MSELASQSRRKIAGGNSMRPGTLLTVLLTAFYVTLSGCGNAPNCPVCGTTTNGSYAVIDVIPVPEHNPTGEPGGPFNSFDISWVDPVHHLDYVSDRIGLAVVVVDTTNNLAVNAIQGVNSVTDAGDAASPCVTDINGNDIIPPLVSVNGNFTRFGCRTSVPNTTEPFHLSSGFGANHLFGGFPGAQCCASRGNGVNPMSGPDGEVVTPDGNTLFTGNGSSSVVVFDLTKNPPVVIADIPTGVPADYDGPLGIAPCIASWNGEAGSSAFCGDDRADELSYDPKDQILAVINGDPGLPFITFIDVSGVVARTSNCLPIDPTTPYGPPALGSPAGNGSSTTPSTGPAFNPPSCILGQIYYDGVFPVNNGVRVDTAGGSCPDPSNPTALSGVSGTGTTPGGKAYNIPCHHGPIIDIATGNYDPKCNPGALNATCIAAISPAGLGGHAWDPNTGYFLLTNENSTTITNVGSVDVINPKSPFGPIVINSFPILNCMPTGVTQGPGDNFLVGCADHDGEAFPPNEYVMVGATGQIVSTIWNVGGVDETWYNPGDNRYYLAARDMPTGPVMGIIDAGSNLWLQNVTTNANSHSIAVDPSTNHAFVPMQAGGICTTQSSNGCIAVMAEQ
jgi:hypothetical protein